MLLRTSEFGVPVGDTEKRKFVVDEYCNLFAVKMPATLRRAIETILDASFFLMVALREESRKPRNHADLG